MQSELEKVAEAIRDELASGAFSKEFTPAETYDPDLKLEDADTLQVDVVPVRSEPERQDRGNIKWLNIIDIGIRYRFGTTHQDDATGEILNRHVHELFYLEQELVTFLFQHQKLTNHPNAALSEGPTVRIGWVTKHMSEWRQFTGIIRVTYQSETVIDP